MMKLKKKRERDWRTKMKKNIMQNILNWHKMIKLKKIKEKKKALFILNSKMMKTQLLLFFKYILYISKTQLLLNLIGSYIKTREKWWKHPWIQIQEKQNCKVS